MTSKVVYVTYVSDTGYGTIADNVITVTPITARETRIDWTNLRSLPYLSIVDDDTLYIQRSGTKVSGWVTIGKAKALDAPSFVDIDANNTLNRTDIAYYRLIIPAHNVVTQNATAGGKLDYHGAEIARRHYIALSKGLAGTRVFVFIKMRGSTRCPQCWDEILQQRSRVNCAVCDGTGYLIGYYNPIMTYMSMGSEVVSIQQDLDGPTPAPDNVQAWTNNYPMLNIGDIVMEYPTNRYWSVNQVAITMHKRVVTKQEVTLNKEEGDDPLLLIRSRISEAEAYG